MTSTLELLKSRITWNDLDHRFLRQHLELCLREDLGSKRMDKPWKSDLTTSSCFINGNGKASIVARENMVCSGLALIPLLFEVFKTDNIHVGLNLVDGDFISKGSLIGHIEGSVDHLLVVERTLLNFLQKLSGISTYASNLVKIVEPYGVGLLDTRKTTPGMRQLEKYATACGGCFNHRMGLNDRILIKDNHLAAAKIDSSNQLLEFLARIREKKPNVMIELEIDHLEYIDAAIDANVDILLLDNFSSLEVKDAVTHSKGKILIEVSGGINIKNLEEFAKSEPNFISTGAPTHSSRWMDIGLDWD